MVTNPVITMKRKALTDTIRSAKGDPTRIDNVLKAVDAALSKAYAAACIKAQGAAAARPIQTAADVYAPDRTIPDSYQTERPSEAAEAIYFALNMLDTLQLPVYGIAESPSAQLFTIVRMTEALGWEEGYSMALGKERT